jgi:hypothetical protein
LSYRLEFSLLHRDWSAADPNDLLHTGGHQKPASVPKVKSTEQVAGKQGLLKLFQSVRPPTDALVERQKTLVTLCLKKGGNERLAS